MIYNNAFPITDDILIHKVSKYNNFISSEKLPYLHPQVYKGLSHPKDKQNDIATQVEIPCIHSGTGSYVHRRSKQRILQH